MDTKKEITNKLTTFLEKRKLWLGLILGITAVHLVLILAEILLTVGQGIDPLNGPLIPALLVWGTIDGTITYIYYVYRLLYLYKNIEKRKLWTALTIIGCLLPIFGSYVSAIPETIASGINILGYVIQLCCWFYDILLVFL